MLQPMPALLIAVVVALPYAANAGDDAPRRYDVVQLAVSAEAEVDNDLLVAVLFKEHQSANQADATNVVNQVVSRAVARIKDAGLPVQTASYRTYPVYRDRAITAWRVHQAIRIESGDARKLAALLGDLQQDLLVQSLQNNLSPRRRREAEDALVVEALNAFKARATLVAGTLERGGYRIVHLNVSAASAGQPPPGVVLRAATLGASSVAEPAVEGGTQRVDVRVDGSIELNDSR